MVVLLKISEYKDQKRIRYTTLVLVSVIPLKAGSSTVTSCRSVTCLNLITVATFEILFQSVLLTCIDFVAMGKLQFKSLILIK